VPRMMTSRRAGLAALVASWLAMGAFAPPVAMLSYDLAGLLGDPASLQKVEPGGQYPQTIEERTIAPPPAPAPKAAPPRRADWTLTIDTSVIGDSNVTNGTHLTSAPIDSGNGPLPVPLDPSLRAKSGFGLGVSATAAGRIPLSNRLAVALDAEGYVVDYEGKRSDDASALVAGGVELTGKSGAGNVQLIAFDRWYGGVSAMSGFGLRAKWRQDVGPGRHLGLYFDGRRYESGYGERFDGTQIGAYLTYDAALSPTLTAAGGVYARRDWLRDRQFSNSEVGAYGSLTHYLSDDITGGVSAGVSRLLFDAPILYLSPDARRDWRAYGSVYIAARRPIGLGLLPSLTYTYGRTDSSIDFYSAERHRLRFSLSRSF
jgi:hypothetical protein